MTAKRFILDDCGELIDLNNHKFIDYGEECCNLLNGLAEENTRLKIRNNRQCQTLDKLYKLIEKQDWDTLTGIVEIMNKTDEQLQKEWSEIE